MRVVQRTMARETPNVPVKSVERTIRLIESIQRRNGASVTELAADLGVAKSTVHNHLRTLERHGYLVREEDVFGIGLRFLDHGGFARERRPAYGIVQPKVRDLAEETGELCQFVVTQRGRGVVLFQVRGERAVETRSRVGTRGPLHSMPAGKAILAHLPPERVREMINEHGLPAATDDTITDRQGLRADLERIVERGYAINRAEHIGGLNALSVPITSGDEDLLGALAVVGPSHRLNDDEYEREVVDALLEAANELELNVTYSRL